MSDKEILAELNKGMIALNKGIRGVKQALSSANIAVGQAEAYNKGLNDAWELAKKIVVDCKDMTGKEFQDIFGYYLCEVFVNYTPQEALAKLEAYEKEQEKARQKIMVGDIVTLEDGTKGVVMDEDGVDNVVIFTENGCIEAWMNKKYITKTGKHIDIQSLLEQIKE